MLSQLTSRWSKFESTLFKLVSSRTIKLSKKILKRKRNNYFYGFCIVLGAPVPHSLTFDVSDDYATVTWKITGDFIVDSYHIYLFHSSNSETLGQYQPVTNTSPMTYTLKLLKGVYYDTAAVYANSFSTCGNALLERPGLLSINHLTGNKVLIFYLSVRLYNKTYLKKLKF